ncbi:hypothetical protein [Candidatus Accumulibacter sp. ACC003]|uniref:hypothetical protein n=1 Tax=Candidatus Accumulibacter sp. ACC003 TaxID=2823334 RepID=UPI0025B815F9|nr:hypothetical protein [Candidatus Accumulibacter sp. ACC003]
MHTEVQKLAAKPLRLAAEARSFAPEAPSLARRARGLLRRSASGDRGRFRLAAAANCNRFLQGIEPSTLAEDLGYCISLERGVPDVTSERHLAVVGVRHPLPQAGQLRSPEIELVAIALGFGEIEFARDNRLVLRQDDQRLPAKVVLGFAESSETSAARTRAWQRSKQIAASGKCSAAPMAMNGCATFYPENRRKRFLHDGRARTS